MEFRLKLTPERYPSRSFDRSSGTGSMSSSSLYLPVSLAGHFDKNNKSMWDMPVEHQVKCYALPLGLPNFAFGKMTNVVGGFVGSKSQRPDKKDLFPIGTFISDCIRDHLDKLCVASPAHFMHTTIWSSSFGQEKTTKVASHPSYKCVNTINSSKVNQVCDNSKVENSEDIETKGCINHVNGKMSSRMCNNVREVKCFDTRRTDCRNSMDNIVPNLNKEADLSFDKDLKNYQKHMLKAAVEDFCQNSIHAEMVSPLPCPTLQENVTNNCLTQHCQYPKEMVNGFPQDSDQYSKNSIRFNGLTENSDLSAKETLIISVLPDDSDQHTKDEILVNGFTEDSCGTSKEPLMVDKLANDTEENSKKSPMVHGLTNNSVPGKGQPEESCRKSVCEIASKCLGVLFTSGMDGREIEEKQTRCSKMIDESSESNVEANQQSGPARNCDMTDFIKLPELMLNAAMNLMSENRLRGDSPLGVCVRLLSDCSDESDFIVFADEDECSEDEEEFTDNECDDDEEDDTQFEDETELNLPNKQREKKVQFNLKPEVHVMRVWDFASRAARIGKWEEAARDRARFSDKIRRAETLLSPVLHPHHRNNVWLRLHHATAPTSFNTH